MPATTSRIELNDPSAYQKKLRALLGDRLPLEVLAETADILESMVNVEPTELLRRRPFEGKWTPNEILGHLVDTELVYGYRLRAILCDERPTIIGMDQEKWVAAQEHNLRDPSEHVANFRFLRNLNLDLWRKITPEQMRRVGLHNERGEESLGLMLEMEAGHDLTHIDQIRRYIGALAEVRSSS
jgi:hypothetical protein